MEPEKPPVVDLAAARQRNYQIAIDTCKTWAKERGIAPWAPLYRLVFAIFSETGGLVCANDGLAFAPDAEKVRPGWAEGVSQELRSKVRTELRKSLALPYDKIGNNGGSCGILQQLPKEYVSTLFGKTWGWGTIPEVMDVATACRLFLNKLTVSTDTEYVDIDGNSLKGLSPIAVDVLRVQNPKASEARKNYTQQSVDAARHIVDNWGPNYFVPKNATGFGGEPFGASPFGA